MLQCLCPCKDVLVPPHPVNALRPFVLQLARPQLGNDKPVEEIAVLQISALDERVEFANESVGKDLVWNKRDVVIVAAPADRLCVLFNPACHASVGFFQGR